uniref:Uncharacterized protein n=1 Tax=Heterorhabditis bacteriophora TaxID=37862 RepID=A0A1I7WC10_HETBA
MAKVEVQIRSCFCCGLSLATIFVALYTLMQRPITVRLDYTLRNSNMKPHVSQFVLFYFPFVDFTIFIFYRYIQVRYMILLVNVFIYVAMIIASILLLIGLSIYNQWLFVPWIIVISIDIIRGLISVLFIFIFSYLNLARIATGIFFLGLQFFHVSVNCFQHCLLIFPTKFLTFQISLLMIIIAKFQRIHNKKNGITMDRPVGVLNAASALFLLVLAVFLSCSLYDPRAYLGGTSSTYAYSPETRKADYYPDHQIRDQRDPYYSRDVNPGPHDNHGYRY